MIEIICACLGLLQGILACLNKRINWIVYALQMVFLIIFSYHNNIWGDFAQNILYFIICIYSFLVWSSKSKYSDISRLSTAGIIKYSIITVITTLAGWYFLKMTNDPLPLVDSFTTVTTFVALVLMAHHKLECWIVWFINDIAYIYEYFMLPDQATYLMLLYIAWTVLAVVSFIKWNCIYSRTKNKYKIYTKLYK